MTTDRVRDIVAQHGRLAVEIATVANDDDLYRAGLTSHASVNLMLALEDAFDLEFPERLLRRQTFQSIAAIDWKVWRRRSRSGNSRSNASSRASIRLTLACDVRPAR